MCIIIIFCCFHCFIRKRISKLIRAKIHWYLYQLARPCYGEIFFEKSRCFLFGSLSGISQAQKCNNLNPFLSTEPRCRDDATCKSSGDAHRVCLRGQCVCKKHYHQGQDAKCVPGELFFGPKFRPRFSIAFHEEVLNCFEYFGQFCVYFLSHYFRFP